MSMEIATMGKDPIPSLEGKPPFIVMFYVESGERKILKCDFPEEFIKEFEGKEQTATEIPFFFVMGQTTGIHSIDAALKFCKA